MIAVLTHCGKRKLDRPAPARELYTGPLVRRIVDTVDEARRRGVQVDLYFLSARYGLVPEWQVLEPYDETLKDRRDPREWARRVGLDGALRRLLTRHRRLVVNLTRDYVRALDVEALCRSPKVTFITTWDMDCGRYVKARPLARHRALAALLR